MALLHFLADSVALQHHSTGNRKTEMPLYSALPICIFILSQVCGVFLIQAEPVQHFSSIFGGKVYLREVF